MAIYTVHVPSGLNDPLLRADAAAFVRDGFSLGAFLFGPLYLLRHRAVLAALAWIVAVILIGWAARLLHLPTAAEIGLALLVMLFTGLEASSIRRFALYRRGLAIAGLASGRSREESEAAFFRALVEREPVAAAAARAPRPAPTGVIGLFPEAGV